MLLRPARAVDGGADVQLTNVDGPPPPGDALHSRTWIHKTVCISNSGEAGDAILLRVNYVSGSAIFGSIVTSLTIP